MAVIKEDRGDAGAAAGTSYTISLGDIFQGTLDSGGDKDWIKVELSAETIYDFTLGFTVEDVDSAELALFDASGNWIVSGGYTPSGTKLIFSPSVSGTYYLGVGSYDDAVTGVYELALTENTIPVGSYDEIAGYLTDGYWGSRIAFDVEPGGSLTVNITALTEEGQRLARWAIEAWDSVTSITFEFVDDDTAHITFTDDLDWAHAGVVHGDGLIESSMVSVPEFHLIEHGTTIDSYTFYVYFHETGHALGLGHPGPYNGSPFYYGYHNIFVNDSDQLSIMSYVNQGDNTYLRASSAESVTPMIVDIIAIQDLYGVPDTINTGDTIYGYQSNVDGYLGEYFRLWTGEENPFFSVEVPSNVDHQALKLALADLDGDGDLDLVGGNNTGLLYYFENIGTPANPDFTERTGVNNPLEGISVQSYSAPTFTDLDGDGDLDIIVGDGNDAIAYFENTGAATSGHFIQRSDAANPFSNITMGSWSTLAFADLDGDGDSDLAVGTNDGDVPYYENTGTKTNPEFALRTGTSSPLNNINEGSYNSPVFVDVDNDDDFDLIVGNRGGGVLYFENTGTTTEPDFTQRRDFDNPFQGINAGFFLGIEFGDLNGDGNLDFIVGNQDGVIAYYKNTGTVENPKFSPQSLARPTTFTIYDNGGTDTLDVRTDTNDQRIYLRPEGISDVYGLIGNVIIARDTWIENVIAGSGDDLIAGNAIANDLNGRAGNDRIWGSGGDDILQGGAGADRLNGDAGMDWAAYRDSDAGVTINLAERAAEGGHAEGDVLTEIENIIGSAHDDVLVGDDEDNRLEGGSGGDRLDGGAGLDWASYQGSNEGVTVDLAAGTAEGGDAQGDVIENIENLSGSGFADVLRGDGNANRLEGKGGDDRLWGAGGEDVLVGGDGNDWLLGSSGIDQLDGGAGLDGLSYELSAAGVTVNLGERTSAGGDAQGDVFTGIEHVMGSEYRDVLTGDAGANELYGLGGDDELRGNEGDDVLEGGTGGDRLDGGAGLDWAVYLTSDAGVTVNLADNTAVGGHAQGDTFTGIENIAGSGYEDILTGDSGANELYGAGGNDELRGGADNDALEGGPGADRLDGGGGPDWVVYLRSDTGVTVDLYNNTVAGGHAEGDVISGIENIAGSALPDVLTGDDSANELAGNGGADELRGNGGDDVLAGGAGADRLDGGAGADTLSYRLSVAGVRVDLAAGTAAGGYAEGDTFTGMENVTGSGYRDSLTGDAGANRLEGAGGDDALHGGAGADVLHGDGGNDELHGGVDKDQLFGGAGADSLYGDDGDDELEGGAGDDWLYGNAGADRLDGGRGLDWVSYLGSGAGVRINLAMGTVGGGDAEGDVLTAIENLMGSGYDDVLRGDGVGNMLYGLDGADELYGNAGDDVLQGGAGADQLDGGEGIDTLSYEDSDQGIIVNLVENTVEGGHAQGDVIRSIENVIGTDYADAIRGDDGANHLVGGAGDDRLHGGGGADRLDGGEGIDWIDYLPSDVGVTVNLLDGTGKGGSAEGDVITGVEDVSGTDYKDVLTGDHKNNTFYGYAGDDELHGNGGDDWLVGGAGADMLDGGGGSDTASYLASDTGVTINLEEGTSKGGHAEGDVIVNIESIRGSNQGDVLTGDNSDNSLLGFAGDDEMHGNGGDDFLHGLIGNDSIYGGEGDDQIHGGDGNDTLYGGEGNDAILGYGGDDIIYGDEGNDSIFGYDGDDNIHGGRGHDVLIGRAGADLLDGGVGNDYLAGHIEWSNESDGSVDVFIFDVGHGDDTIYFVNDEDKIDLSAFNLSGFDDINLSSATSRPNVSISGLIIDMSAHDGGTILLVDFDITNLDASDFLF